MSAQAPVLGPGSVLRVRPLTVVEHGADFLVGDPAEGSYVVLPRVGVQVIELLRSGLPLCEVSVAAARSAGTNVDVMDFAGSLCELGFAEPSDRPAPGATLPPEPAGSPTPPDQGPARRRWAAALNGPSAWLLAALAAAGCAAAFAVRPGLWPSYRDAFPLSTPALSVVFLAAAAYALAGLHELCHWLAARAEGVRASVRIDRRLFMVAFETDLTGLWGLPRHRRYWPLLIGMAFDTVVLAAVLAVRLTADGGLWRPAPELAKMLAALTFLQVAAIGMQFFVFVRTDVYAVMVTATGCSNLWEVTRLTLRRRLGLAGPAHKAELRAAHPRDKAVARWYAWLYVAGMLLAAWVFAAYFVPATVQVVRWVIVTLAAASPGQGAFWQAAGFGLVLLSSQLLTLGVVARDAARRFARRAVRSS